MFIASVPYPPPIPEAYNRTRERFLDSDNISSSSGVTRSIASLTKYGSNPVIPPAGVNTQTWDYDVYFPTVLYNGTTYQMWVHAYDDAFTILGMTYSTSADANTWVKPNLGFVTYDGNTNNNLLFNDVVVGWVLYDPTAPADRKYLMVGEYLAGDPSAIGTYLFKSPTGYSDWVYVQQIRAGTGPNTFNEAKGIFRRSDGKYIAYYTSGHSTQTRHVIASLSDSTDPEDPWTTQGTVIPTTDADEQHYAIQVWETDGLIYALSAIYDNTTETIYRVDLYTSPDGLDFTLIEEGVLEIGAGGSFDDSMVLPSVPVRIGNTWRFFYSGSAQEHDVVVMNDSRIGYASIGYERFGTVGTSGTLTTTPIYIPAGYTLRINANASGGSLDVEILSVAGNVLTNYAQADFDTLTTDVYDHEAEWGGSPIVGSAAIRLKFYLTDATLYGYWIEAS